MAAERLANAQPCVPIVFLHRSSYPSGGTMAFHIARQLHDWALRNPDPYTGPHWLGPP